MEYSETERAGVILAEDTGSGSGSGELGFSMVFDEEPMGVLFKAHRGIVRVSDRTSETVRTPR